MNFYQGLIGTAIVAGLLSCNKHDNIYKGPESPKLGELTIPAGFDWKTSDDVKCVVTASQPARVEVYAQENCIASSRLASLYVNQGAEPMRLVVARGINQVYMRYMDADSQFRVMPVSINNGQIAFALPEGSQNFASGLRSKSSEPSDELSKLEVEGTLLFEDSYPEKGDYDFNDYVMTYDFEIELKHKKVQSIEGEIKFVAKGGKFPYEPYLSLRGIKEQHDKNDFIIKSEDGVGIDSDFAHIGNDQDLILKFTGVPEAMARMKREGSQYINTTKGATDDDFVEIEFKLQLNGNDLNKYDGGDIYDFFLGRDLNGKFVEIHGKEFSSTRLATDKVEEGGYCTADNFVWVLKINEDLYDDDNGDYEVFPYLNEEVDFLKGYPRFKDFIQSNVNDWYKKQYRDDEHLIFFED